MLIVDSFDCGFSKGFWNDDNKLILIKMEESGELAIEFKSKAYYFNPSDAIEVDNLSEYTPVGYPVGDIQSKLNDMYIVQNTVAGVSVTPRRTGAQKERVKTDAFIFDCPVGTILNFCNRNYLYLYSAMDNKGLLKHYGISGDEVMNEQPIVDEIAYYDMYKPTGRVMIVVTVLFRGSHEIQIVTCFFPGFPVPVIGTAGVMTAENNISFAVMMRR